jgi:hypothetical protein
MKIRAATEADRDVIWKIFHEIVTAGDTYAFDPKMSREQALAYWFRADAHTYVAELDRQSVGEAVGFPGAATPSPRLAAVLTSPMPPLWWRQMHKARESDEEWPSIV